MKTKLVYFFFFPLFLQAQPDTLYGVVSVLNSRYEKGETEYLSGVEIRNTAMPHMAPVHTGPDGRFALICPGPVREMPLYLLLEVPGYQVANLRELQRRPVRGDTLRICVIENSVMNEAVQRYYTAAYTTLQKSVMRRRRAEPYASMTDQELAQKFHLAAISLSRKFTALNLDDAGPLLQDAFRRFQAGSPDGALRWLQQSDISGLSPREQIRLLDFKADLHYLRLEWDSVEQCYLQQLRLDDGDPYVRWFYATFLISLNRNGEALELLEKCLPRLYSGIDSAALLVQLGNLHHARELPSEAEQAFEQALVISRRLIRYDSAQFDMSLAEEYGVVAGFYGETGRPERAIDFYVRALDLVRSHRQVELLPFGQMEAGISLMLATFLEQEKRFDEAARHCGTAIELYTHIALARQMHVGQDFGGAFDYSAELRDSLAVRRQYVEVVALQRLRAHCVDTLRALGAEYAVPAAREYGSLSWHLLFAGRYVEAEQAACEALALDDTQHWVRTNLGHSFLLRGDWKQAKRVYDTYIGQDGEPAKKALLKDFDDLEAAGVRHKLIGKARNWVREQQIPNK